MGTAAAIITVAQAVLAQEVAQGVVAEVAPVGADAVVGGDAGQAVEFVIVEVFPDVLCPVPAPSQVAQAVVAVGQVLQGAVVRENPCHPAAGGVVVVQHVQVANHFFGKGAIGVGLAAKPVNGAGGGV